MIRLFYLAVAVDLVVGTLVGATIADTRGPARIYHQPDNQVVGSVDCDQWERVDDGAFWRAEADALVFTYDGPVHLYRVDATPQYAKDLYFTIEMTCVEHAAGGFW